MALKITFILAFSKRRIQARCKNSVKFIRRGYTFNRLKAGCLQSENSGSGFKVGIFIEKLLALGHLALG
jgi:hypothetical protein